MEEQTQTVVDTSLGRKVNWLRVLADLLIVTTILTIIAIILIIWRLNTMPTQSTGIGSTTVPDGSITTNKLANGAVGLGQLSPDIASYLQSAMANQNAISGGTIVGGCTYFVVCNTPIVEQANIAIQSVSPYFVGEQLRAAKGQVNDILQVQNSSGFPMVNINANGQIGVNNPLPQTTLDVNGTGRFLGHTAFGNMSAIDNPSIITPLTGTPIIRVNGTQEVVTNLTPGYNYYSGESAEYFVNLGQSATNQLFTGGYHAGEIVSGNPQNYAGLGGETGIAVHEGTGNISLMAGIFGYTFNNSSGTLGGAAGTFGYLINADNGTIGTGSGAGGILQNSGSGTVSLGSGLNGLILNTSSGSIQNANGVTTGIKNSGSGTITNASIVDIQPAVNSGSGSITNLHGLYIADESGIGTSESFNIYSRGVSSKNVFNGAASFGGDPTIFGTDSKLMVAHNPAFGFQTTDNATSAQINAGLSDTGLVLQGTAFGTGDLQQWQSFDGTVLGKVTSAGTVGIGTGTVTHELTVTNTATTNVAKFNGSGGTQCTVVTGTGWSCSSDETLKTNILNIGNGLDVINKIQGVTYNWKADPNGTKQDGFIAQDIQKILPELVTTDSEGKLSLNKDGIMPFIVEAVKQQNGNIDAANKKLTDQGVQLTSLSDEFKALATRVDTLETQVKDLQGEVQQLKQKVDGSSAPPTSSPAPSQQTPTSP